MISVFSTLFPSGTTLLDLITIAVVLFVVWIIISVPAYIAGKLVTKGKATFGEAMLATVLGPIIYIIALTVLDFLLGGLFGSVGYAVAFVLAFIAWIWVYKSVFKTSWLGALAIAILAVIVFVVVLLLIGFLGFLPTLMPTQPLQNA